MSETDLGAWVGLGWNFAAFVEGIPRSGQLPRGMTGMRILSEMDFGAWIGLDRAGISRRLWKGIP